jgi:uncharacterized protein
MKVIDAIYGEFEIKEAVIIDILNHPAFLRLKGVQQYGTPPGWVAAKGFTRHEHSIGTFLLLRKLGASLKEQLAGLLHDVSHTAFSHVIDIVYDCKKENFQDLILEKYLEETGIASILKKYGFDHKDIAAIEEFTLLDKELPDLCADRVDYCLRELYHNNKEEVVNVCVPSLGVCGDKIVFKNQEVAKLFAHNFLDRQFCNWGEPGNTALHVMFANTLKKAVELGVIDEGDFFSEDNLVMQKLIDSGESSIVESLDKLSQGINYEVVSEKESNFPILTKKFRYVDPLFLSGLDVKRLSHVDGEFAYTLVDCKQRYEKGTFVRLY